MGKYICFSAMGKGDSHKNSRTYLVVQELRFLLLELEVDIIDGLCSTFIHNITFRN